MIDLIKATFAGTATSTADKLLRKGDRARNAKRWNKAADLYTAYLSNHPHHAEIRVQLGHALKEAGRLNEAEVAYTQAASQMPSVVENILHLGRLQKIMGHWEASKETFVKALDLDKSLAEPVKELVALGYPPAKLRSLIDLDDSMHSPPDETEKYCFDVSDLIQYFQDSRVATGIQRFQILILRSLISEEIPERKISVISYSSTISGWVHIPNAFFIELTGRAAQASDVNDLSWRQVLNRLNNLLYTSNAVRFARGAFLVNLGTSWWIKNYFVAIRKAQADFEVNYVPFVHDCIPLLMPEHCESALTRDFRTWIRGVFDHADHYICNSKWTRRDLKAVAKEITGLPSIAAAVVRLDGDARNDAHNIETNTIDTLEKFGLVEGNFVLFVSTLEPRKNHKLLFEVWLRLLQTQNSEHVPMLICVGKKGWKTQSTIEMLSTSVLLRKYVVLAHNVSDTELAALYKSCRFTVYPSLYEGWGLPVTESLCYGKPVICSSSSSLPEAGGNFVVYIDPTDGRDLENRIVDFLTKPDVFAAAKESAKRFEPRTWREIAQELLDSVESMQSDYSKCLRQKTAAPKPGKIYLFNERNVNPLVTSLPSGERFRLGDGWSSLDEFGCWMEKHTAELGFVRPDITGPIELSLLLSGLPSRAKRVVNLTIGLAGRRVASINIPPGKRRVARIQIPESEWPNSGMLVVSFTSDCAEPLARHTSGLDNRIVHGALIAMMQASTGDYQSQAQFRRYEFLSMMTSLTDAARKRFVR